MLVDGQCWVQNDLLRAIAQRATPEDLPLIGAQFARKNLEEGRLP